MIRVTWLLTAISLYLTYYTFIYARHVWKGGNKFAGVVLTMLAGCFPTLSIWLSFG